MGKVKRRLGGLAHVEEKSKVEKVSEKVEEEEKSVADIHSALLIGNMKAFFRFVAVLASFILIPPRSPFEHFKIRRGDSQR